MPDSARAPWRRRSHPLHSRLLVSLFVLLFAVAPAQAAEPQTVASSSPTSDKGSVEGEARAADANQSPAIGQQPATGAARRLIPLDISFAVLQALDVHSTLRAIDRGAFEGNLFMQPLAGRPAAFVAVKAGVTAGLIFATHRLGRRHQVAAFTMMLAANGLYAALVAHNYRVAARLGGR